MLASTGPRRCHEPDRRRPHLRTREADVCVVGAGLAGLTAARLLSSVPAGGRARGSRPCRRAGLDQDERRGVPVDMGGCFVGPGHDRLHALATEMGVRTFPTFVDGDNVLATGGTVQRYRGDIPRINPLALLSAAQATASINAMAKKVPVDAPWDAPKAAGGTRSRCGPGSPRRESRPGSPASSSRPPCERASRRHSEVSLLYWLFLVRSAGGVESLMNIAGGYQDSQFEGGVGRVTDAMAAELGDAVVLSSPVTALTQHGDRVEVRLRRARCRRAASSWPFPERWPPPSASTPAPGGPRAAPPSDACGDRGEDGCHLRRALLAPRRHLGCVRRHRRHDRDHARHHPAGPRPRGRRHVLPGPGRALAALRRPNGTGVPSCSPCSLLAWGQAASPLEVLEVNWAEERWTRGCSMAHFPTGVLTQYGRRLREPVGRVHWAGTETATVSGAHGRRGALRRTCRRGDPECGER